MLTTTRVEMRKERKRQATLWGAVEGDGRGAGSSIGVQAMEACPRNRSHWQRATTVSSCLRQDRSESLRTDGRSDSSAPRRMWK